MRRRTKRHQQKLEQRAFLLFFFSAVLFSAMFVICDRCSVEARQVVKSNETIIREIVNDPDRENLFLAMAEVESSFNANAKGLSDEVGLFQLKWSTVKNLGCAKNIKQLSNAAINTKCAVEYFNKLQNKFGPIEESLYAYNIGEGNAAKQMYSGDWLDSRRCKKNSKKKYAQCHVRKVLLAMKRLRDLK